MASVNISYYRGLTQLPVSTQNQLTTGGAYALEQPQISSETLSTSGTAASSAVAPSNTKLAHVQVPDGSTIRYVWNPPGYSVTASTTSPSMSGHQTFPVGPNWTLSAIDA